ncbi:hypothetical protein CI726_14285 [Shigella sonnei]|nr:hypothetical protein CI726_14285 [Shigella sonnei]
MIWQPEFTDKTLSRKPGAVQNVGHTEYITTNRIDSLTHWLNVTCADLADPAVEITDDDMKSFHDIINLANLTCHKNTVAPKLISFE